METIRVDLIELDQIGFDWIRLGWFGWSGVQMVPFLNVFWIGPRSSRCNLDMARGLSPTEMIMIPNAWLEARMD